MNLKQAHALHTLLDRIRFPRKGPNPSAEVYELARRLGFVEHHLSGWWFVTPAGHEWADHMDRGIAQVAPPPLFPEGLGARVLAALELVAADLPPGDEDALQAARGARLVRSTGTGWTLTPHGERALLGG